MLASAREFLQSASWIVTEPGLAIPITVLAINLVGDGLRDALDPEDAEKLMALSAWIGPAIVATLIASLVQIIDWWIAHRHERSRTTESRARRSSTSRRRSGAENAQSSASSSAVPADRRFGPASRSGGRFFALWCRAR